MGSNLPLNLKYLIPGDINRSHSSQVVDTAGVIKSFSIGYINTPNINKDPVDVSLNNLTVTSNTVEIPININTTNNVGALQFEFDYDSTKIKFESLATNLPNTWFTFDTHKDGRIKSNVRVEKLQTTCVELGHQWKDGICHTSRDQKHSPLEPL